MSTLLNRIGRHMRRHCIAIGMVSIGLGALLATAGDAEAGYGCVENATQIGSTVTIEIVATSGGTEDYCVVFEDIGIVLYDVSVSGAVTLTQLGATVDAAIESRASVLEGQFVTAFSAACVLHDLETDCSNSISESVDAMDGVECSIVGDPLALPEPALPGVPVVLTTICSFSY